MAFSFYHVKRVETSERCSDLLRYLRLVGEEVLQDSRLGKDLLHLLGPSQVSPDIGTFDSLGALHEKSGFPSLRGGGGLSTRPA